MAAENNSSDELDRLKVMLRTISRLDEASLIFLDDCELSVGLKSDQDLLISSIPSELRKKIKFRSDQAT